MSHPLAKLLVIETSPRGEASISRQLTRRFVADWQAAHPQGLVVVRDLADTQVPHVNAPWLAAYFTPEDKQTQDMKEALRLSDTLVAELMGADHIVIASPVYNYNVPAALKAWIDHIVRKGYTLGFDGKGLLTGKSATVLIASGGVYTEGSPIRDRNIAELYLRLVLNVIGITDVTVVAGGGAKAVDMRDTTMEAFVAQHAIAIQQAARA
jgi:FMN-dependent NADH-azoreductase